jgi:hypothetical protein
MKLRLLIIIGLILLVSVTIIQANPFSVLKKNKVYEQEMIRTDGRIYGWVETQGRCMKVGVPNLKIACGKNFNDYKIIVTDKDGFFNFTNVTYENSGTSYLIWIFPGQKVFYPGFKNVILNNENPKEEIYFFVLVWRSLIINKQIIYHLSSLGYFVGLRSI